MRGNPRMTLAALLGAAGLLLGVAIGWAAARRGADAPTATPDSVESGAGRVDAESAGRVAPATPVVPQRSVQPPRSTPRRDLPRRARANASRSARTPAPVPVAPTPVDSAAAVPRADTATLRADSVRRETARVELLAAERDAIRRELEARRARVDSLTRRVGELAPPQPPATPPRR